MLEHMSEEESRLATLYFLRRVQVQQLEQTDRWIQAEEQRTAAEDARPAPATTPDWVVEPSAVQGHVPTLHRGGCSVARRRLRPVSGEVARRGLGEQIVEACDVCRPEGGLGL